MSLLASLALVFLLGLCFGWLMEQWHLPSLLGFLLAGIWLGQTGLLGEALLALSPSLRQFALVCILLKAGLSLSWDRLEKVGRPGLLLSFVPAICEILGCVVLAPVLFSISVTEALLLGTVLAAVSPAVVVPRMVAFMEKKTPSLAPEMVLAGASLDDVFVIVLFGTALSLAEGEAFSWTSLLDIPISICLGLVAGLFLGKMLGWLFCWAEKQSFTLGGEQGVILLLALSFLLLELETWIPLSGLLGVMVMAMVTAKVLNQPPQEKTGENPPETVKIWGDLSKKTTALWQGAQILLFVLVGAEVQVAYLWQAGISGLLLLCFVLLTRSFGVFLATSGGKLEKNERIFVLISYLPKATVQAGVGGIPLALGLPCGSLVLSLAVLSIVITAPVAAILIDRFGDKLLQSPGK